MRLAILLALAGCGAGGDDGGVTHDMAVELPDLALCDDTQVGDGGLAPTFTNVQRVFDYGCTGCHCCNDPLTLTGGVSYAMLINRAPPRSDSKTDESCGGVLVAPGDAGVSYLYQKISSPHPCAGNPMPLNEFNFVPLPACAQDVVRRWIDRGAPND